jgi:hypothetical protein
VIAFLASLGGAIIFTAAVGVALWRLANPLTEGQRQVDSMARRDRGRS